VLSARYLDIAPLRRLLV